MKRVLLILLAFACLVDVWGSTKRALTVFIAEYPKESGWNSLASHNDRQIILKMLYDNGFSPSDVTCLEDSQATCSNILDALRTLAASAGQGDQVYVHFSCHGQQITDLDGDESLRKSADRYDEALVPYDAFVAYNWHGYKGENHLIDDVLNMYLAEIQRSVGKKGCLLVIHDACHSGDIEMGPDSDERNPHRGSFDAFEQPLVPRKGKAVLHDVNWISISACKSFQTNYEVEIDGKLYGRLSYAVSKCFRAGMRADYLIQSLTVQYSVLPMPKNKVQSLTYFLPEYLKSKAIF